jgi:hypothetical protein
MPYKDLERRREAVRKACRKHYQANKEKTRERTRKSRRRNQAFVLKWLIEHPCVDCGGSDPIVLQFDHLGDKESDITVAARRGWSLARLQKEINKCEIRCANCHVRKTLKGSYKDI